jgi:glutamine synthetase
MDHTANIYLAMSIILRYGLKGLSDKARLPQPFNGDV